MQKITLEGMKIVAAMQVIALCKLKCIQLLNDVKTVGSVQQSEGRHMVCCLV